MTFILIVVLSWMLDSNGKECVKRLPLFATLGIQAGKNLELSKMTG